MKKFSFLKIVYLLIFIVIFSSATFARDVRLNLTYGINNQAKRGKKLPIEVVLDNKDDSIFQGSIQVYMYYQNDSCVEYEYPISINSLSTLYKDFDISIGPNFNSLLVHIVDNNNELVTEEKINIDSQSLSSELIVGILSDAPWKMDYFNGVLLGGNKIKTKTVNIEKRALQRNPSILDSVDTLIISDINTKTFSQEIENILYSYLSKGNVIILGTGEYGVNGIPNIFEKYLDSPVFVNDEQIEFNINNEKNTKRMNYCYYNFDGNNSIITYKNKEVVRSKNIGTGVLANSNIAFGDLRSDTSFNQNFAKELIKKSLGDIRLFKYQQRYDEMSLYDLDDISDIINIADSTILPDMKILTLICVLYVIIIASTVIICCTNRRRKKYYVYILLFISIVFSINISIIFIDSKKQNDFASYVKIVDITDFSNEENMYITTVSPKRLYYELKTNLSNRVYAIINQFQTKGDLSADIKNNSINKTKISQLDDKIKIEVNNKNNFVPTYLELENNNVNRELYNIESKISLINNVLDGYVINKTDYNIKNATIVFYDGIVKIGNLEKGERVFLRDYKYISLPIQNNFQISENVASYPRSKILKNYLDSHISGYYDNAKIIGFIEDKSITPLESENIKEKSGITLISLAANVRREIDGLIESSSLQYGINNISGEYNIIDNTIAGLNTVENEYFFNHNLKTKELIIQNVENYAGRNLDWTVAFEGNIYLYNYLKNSYDLWTDSILKEVSIDNYLSPAGSVKIKFESRIQDVFNRKISLPIVKALQYK